ncbi:hypothetical protein BJX99DRAFT_263628 [Aspergillus californicus]
MTQALRPQLYVSTFDREHYLQIVTVFVIFGTLVVDREVPEKSLLHVLLFQEWVHASRLSQTPLPVVEPDNTATCNPAVLPERSLVGPPSS